MPQASAARASRPTTDSDSPTTILIDSKHASDRGYQLTFVHDLYVLALFKPASRRSALLRSEPGFHDRLFGTVVDGNLDLS
jgi:hypothetical protein